MSGLNSIHITVPQAEHYHSYSHCNSRNSFSSNGSSGSPISSTNDGNWDSRDMDSNDKRSTKRGVSTFITKLFGMVSDGRNQHLISWNPSGTSFLVCNATRFSQEVLPEHFKHSNFSSFVRQLNMYGFHKINKSPRGQRGNNENEVWEFSHTKFQRGRPDILEGIKRKAMDSELLRRETGDIHASFAMVQLSQADLLQQFRVLQENFANLLQGFEDMKKVQLQQQIIIRRLAECQGLPSASPMQEFENNNNNQPSVLITSPSTTSAYAPLQHWSTQDQQQQQRLQQDVVMPPVYQTKQQNQQYQQQQSFNFQLGNPFPPSPVSSVLLSSPPSSSGEGQCSDQNIRHHQHRMSHGMNLGFPDQ